MSVVYETVPGRYRVECEVPISTSDTGQWQYGWSPEGRFGSLPEAKKYAQQLSNKTGSPARVVDTRPDH